jgi:proteasome lid subunit RPN8/RPN11
MSSGDFEIIERSFDVPFRTRTLHAGYVVFQADRLNVYITPDIAATIRECAAGAAPRETGGLLAGRILRDDLGHYVMVTGMAQAPPTAGEFGSFSLSPKGTEKLRRVLSEQHPSADVIGWWHSHSAPSSYSNTDRGNQAIWTDPRHIGLLVFAQGTPWAALYVGPQSKGPFRPAGPPPGRVRDDGARSRPAPGPSGADGAPQPPWRVSGSLSSRRRRAAVILAVFGVLLVGTVIAWRALNSGPASVTNQVTCEFNGTTASCSTPWKGKVEWGVDDLILGQGNSGQFHFSVWARR